MSIQEEIKLQFIQSIRGIVISRWVLIIGLGLVGVVQRIINVGVQQLTANRLVVLVVLPIIYNFFFSLYIRRNPERLRMGSLRVMGALQVLIDVFMITAVIYLTGGVESVNFLMYFFPMLTVAILFSALEIIFLAISIVGIYTALVIAEYQEWIDHIVRYRGQVGIYGNISATLLNTMTIDLTIILLSLLAMFANRIIHSRELQLKIERDKVRSILNSLNDGIVLLDTNKHILSMNPPARDLLRIYSDTNPDVLRETDFPTSFQKLIAAVNRDGKKAKQMAQEVMIEEVDTETYIAVDSIPIKDAMGETLSWVKVLRDITHEKEVDNMKRDFISVAAHQLRTPLAGLKWFFKLMSDGDAGTLTKEQKELIDQAYQKNNQVIDIVNDLLDVSELEEKDTHYEYAEGSVATILHDVIQKSTIDAEQKGVSLEYNEPTGDIPPVVMDKYKLPMVFQNIIDNAIKYSPKGSTVRVRLEFRNQRNFIAISDEGIGIAKKEQKKIFTKFFRATNAKEQENNGSGLGLYIVRNIVKKHKGQIWFDSPGRNKGTTFYITLPVQRKYL